MRVFNTKKSRKKGKKVWLSVKSWQPCLTAEIVLPQASLPGVTFTPTPWHPQLHPADSRTRSRKGAHYILPFIQPLVTRSQADRAVGQSLLLTPQTRESNVWKASREQLAAAPPSPPGLWKGKEQPLPMPSPDQDDPRFRKAWEPFPVAALSLDLGRN